MADGGEGAEHAHGPAHTHALGCNFTPDPADPAKHTHALGCNFIARNTRTRTRTPWVAISSRVAARPRRTRTPAPSLVTPTRTTISSLPAMPPRPAIPPAERRKGDAVQPEQRAWLPCTRSNSSNQRRHDRSHIGGSERASRAAKVGRDGVVWREAREGARSGPVHATQRDAYRCHVP